MERDGTVRISWVAGRNGAAGKSRHFNGCSAKITGLTHQLGGATAGFYRSAQAGALRRMACASRSQRSGYHALASQR
jgi:hypothetical protein